jgi:hypothetical protein
MVCPCAEFVLTQTILKPYSGDKTTFEKILEGLNDVLCPTHFKKEENKK